MFAPKQKPIFLSEDFLGELGAQRLSHVLHALYTGNVPVEQSAPISLNAKPGVPPVNVTNWKPGDVIFNFTDGNGNVTGTVTFGPNGLESRDAKGNPFPESDATAAARVEFVGTIQSGTGSTYSVRLDTGDTVTAIQQQINGGQTVPAGTVTTVVLKFGVYIMQVPVFVMLIVAFL